MSADYPIYENILDNIDRHTVSGYVEIDGSVTKITSTEDLSSCCKAAGMATLRQFETTQELRETIKEYIHDGWRRRYGTLYGAINRMAWSLSTVILDGKTRYFVVGTQWTNQRTFDLEHYRQIDPNLSMLIEDIVKEICYHDSLR